MKSEYNSETIHDLDSNCEVVWAKFNLKGNGTVYIGSYYRRHVSDGESLEQLETFTLKCEIYYSNSSI